MGQGSATWTHTGQGGQAWTQERHWVALGVHVGNSLTATTHLRSCVVWNPRPNPYSAPESSQKGLCSIYPWAPEVTGPKTQQEPLEWPCFGTVSVRL